jgi:hypothetical protein
MAFSEDAEHQTQPANHADISSPTPFKKHGNGTQTTHLEGLAEHGLQAGLDPRAALGLDRNLVAASTRELQANQQN